MEQIKRIFWGSVAFMVGTMAIIVFATIYYIATHYGWILMTLVMIAGISFTGAGVYVLAGKGAESWARAAQIRRHAPGYVGTEGSIAFAPTHDAPIPWQAAVTIPPTGNLRNVTINTAPRITGQGNTIEDHDPAPSTERPTSPSLTSMLDMGIIGRGHIYWGIDRDKGTWQSLDIDQDEPASIFTAGRTQSGKSNSLGSLAAQFAAHGARLSLIDPHGKAEKRGLARGLLSLGTASFDGPLALGNTDPMPTLAHVLDIFYARRDGVPANYLAVLVIDELNDLVRIHGKAFLHGVEVIVQQGAKFRVILLASGQMWTANALGNGDVTNSSPHFLIHQSSAATAQRLPGVGPYAKSCERLQPGHALIIQGSQEPRTIIVPSATPTDMAAIGQHLGRKRLIEGAGMVPLRESLSAPSHVLSGRYAAPVVEGAQQEEIGADEGDKRGQEGGPSSLLAWADWSNDQMAVVWDMLVNQAKRPTIIIETVWGVKAGTVFTRRADELAGFNQALHRGHIDTDALRARAGILIGSMA